jgi:hypothetical protein
MNVASLYQTALETGHAKGRSHRREGG